ncbi:MAG: hypothetical protein WBD40_03545 [Tepidisphaeraceae bacterium]
MPKLIHGPGLTVRGPTLADADFQILVLPRDREVTPGVSPMPVTIDDVDYIETTSAAVAHEADVLLRDVVAGTLAGGYTIDVLDPAVATINALGFLTRASANGDSRILVRTRHLTRRVDVPIELDPATVSRVFQNFVAGSLASHCADAINSRLAGKNFADHGRLFSTQDHAAGTYVRNASAWCADLDLTCISPWNGSGGVRQAGTLVSPRHLVNAEHYPYGPGTVVRFVTHGNQVFSRTVTAAVNVGPPNSTDAYDSDVRVCLLDSDVPASISFAKVLPADVEDRFGESLAVGVPGFGLDQEEKASVRDLIRIDNWVTYRVPHDATRQAFYDPIVGGDSGNPAFLVVDGELVLVATWTSGGWGHGPDYSRYLDEINGAMTTLGGGYQLTEADLSGFPSYA